MKKPTNTKGAPAQKKAAGGAEKANGVPPEAIQIELEKDIVATIKRSFISSRRNVSNAERLVNSIRHAAKAKRGEVNARAEAELFAISCVEAVARGDHGFFKRIANYVEDWQPSEQLPPLARALSTLVQLWDDWKTPHGERFRRITDDHGFAVSLEAFNVALRRARES